MPKQTSLRGRLLTKDDLELLRSAELYKLLRFKKVPGRSKLTRKTARASALEGIATYSDLESVNISRPQSVEVYEPQKAEKKPIKPGKGVRTDDPVGGMAVHKDTIYVAIADPAGIKDEKVFRNKESGINDLLNYFKFYGIEHAAIESTSEYWLKMFWKLMDGGIKMLVATLSRRRLPKE